MDDAAALRELWSRLYKTLETGDASAWREALAEDALVIGTDEAEWWQGKDAAMRVIQQQVTELHEAGVRYSDSDPQVNEVAGVYWGADRPNVVLADGTTVRTRFTAVATRVEDALLLCQVHVSIGAPNDEVLQQQLTV
jgi:ketosteroid isomerase-like protein